MRYLILVIELILAVLFFSEKGHALKQVLATDYPSLFILTKFVVFVLIVDVIRRLIRLWYAAKYRMKATAKTNFDYGVDNIAKVVFLLGVIAYLFQFFGVDIRTLLTSLSIVAAAVAITTREYINDFLVGLYFSFSKNFEIHDYVKMGEHKGKITELQVLKLKLLNDDDDAVLIPNAKVYNSEIINYTRRDIRLMSIDFELEIMHIESIEQLEEDLKVSLEEFIQFIEPDSFHLRIVEMKKDYVELKFQYMLQRFDRDLQRQIRKKTVRQVFNHIAKQAASHPS